MAKSGKKDRSVGERPLTLRVMTFGTDPRDRLGVEPRTHNIDPIRRRSPEEVCAAVKGAALAARQAYEEHNLHDLKLSLVRMQRLAVELTRRALNRREVHVVEDTEAYFEKGDRDGKSE